MARAERVQYLISRKGRFYARIVVPKRLRSIVGKVELSTPLGADRRRALRVLPVAVAALQDRIHIAERAHDKQARSQRATVTSAPVKSRILDPEEIARIEYAQAIERDEELRYADHRYAHGFVDEERVSALRDVIAGRADTDAIKDAVGFLLLHYRRRGNHDHADGTPEWRRLARLLAIARLEALRVTAARDDGDMDPDPPEFLKSRPEDGEPDALPLRIVDLFDAYRTELQRADKAVNAETKWRPVIRSLVTYLAHDRSERITRKDAIGWKDRLLEELSPKTVRDFYLATARAAFSWAVDNEMLVSNPFAGVKVRLGKPKLHRERGFDDEEALAILKAAASYEPATAREQARMVAAKRWTPLLAAYTGARIAELTQLRSEDVRNSGGIPYVRITPAAGSVKSGIYRDVPLHPHLIELGLVELARLIKAGPLFFAPSEAGNARQARTVGDRVGKWIASLALSARGVQPNHAWRHRFKTKGRELGIDPRVLDAIQGHSPRTASENYGDVTLKTKAAAIDRYPRYEVSSVL